MDVMLHLDKYSTRFEYLNLLKKRQSAFSSYYEEIYFWSVLLSDEWTTVFPTDTAEPTFLRKHRDDQLKCEPR